MAAQGICNKARCYAAENAQCADGEDYPQDCPNWSPIKDLPTNSTSEAHLLNHPQIRQAGLAWSGNSMGTDDIVYIASRRNPRVIGLVGPHNAGKTTFLAMLYLLVRRGRSLASGTFAGSCSLGGWEKLAEFLSWQSDREPTFPPHTAANESRRPGMLHLAFRDSDNRRNDSLWTDTPGEWFGLWAINKDDPNAVGATWTFEYSNAFILFADSEALSGNDRGGECENLIRLIERMGAHVDDRPVALVWAKSDHEVPVPDTIRARIETTCARYFSLREVFSIQVPISEPTDEIIAKFLALIAWILTTRTQNRLRHEFPILSPEEPILAFRGQ